MFSQEIFAINLNYKNLNIILFIYIIMNTQKQTLVRLTANSLDLTGKQGIFEGTFNDGILIKPNSQIALQSCSLSRDQDSFLVNSANNKISYQVSQAGGLHNIILRNGLYDSDTLFRLLEDIQDKMNDDLDISKTKEHNTFIEVKVTSQNKISFNFMLGKSQSIITSPPANDPSVSGIFYSKNNGANEILLAGSGTTQHITGTANYTPLSGTRQYVYSTIPFQQGAGLIKARIDRFEANDGVKSGCILGLLPDTEAIGSLLASESSSRKVLVGDYKYAICTNTDGDPTSPYMIKTPQTGGFVATAVTPQKVTAGDEVNNDIIMIKMTKGHIQLVVSQAGGPAEGTVVYQEKFERRDSNEKIINLLPYVGIFGSSNQTRIANSSIAFNPEDNDQAGTNFEEPDLPLTATPYPIPQARNTVYNLIFGKEDLANFLGFQELEQNPTNVSTPNQRYLGNKELTKLFSTNTYLIEMLSEQLNSYDSFDGGRKNILAPIPLSDHVISNTGIIHYEPSNLMFINLRNDKEKLIRNMRCRIITNAYESINIEGLADICLLIRG